MNTDNRKKIETIINDRKKAHRYYIGHSEVYRSFVEMEKHAFEDGMLGKKYKELIAIGISIRINCESCVEWHIKQALDSGASQEEIIEAIFLIGFAGGQDAKIFSGAARVIVLHQLIAW